MDFEEWDRLPHSTSGLQCLEPGNTRMIQSHLHTELG